MKKIIKLKPLAIPQVPRKKRVAAYARISLVTAKMSNSLSNQVSAYSSLIQANPRWDYAGVYVDNGISGTKIKKRMDFQRMLEDCEAGKIDLILTKSISRFARNTVDLLTVVRRLKEIGVEVRFEKEHISTFSGDGELMLTILASFAQEEVWSISNNVKWAKRKNFQKGKVPRTRAYGYRWKGNKRLIYEPEAKYVRRIYREFIAGRNIKHIFDDLNAEGVRSINGCPFDHERVRYIVSNSLYVGEIVLQKFYKPDPFSSGTVLNRGELPKYIVTGTHQPIIDRETFDKAQAELKRRDELSYAMLPTATCFTWKIRCAECGSFLTRVADKFYQRAYWSCRKRMHEGKAACSSKQWIPEDELQRCCTEAMGVASFDPELFTEKVDEVIARSGECLLIKLKGGREVETNWHYLGHQGWWTPERREARRIAYHNRTARDKRYSCFTTRLWCSHCSSSLISGLDRRHGHYWGCKKGCGDFWILDSDLRAVVKQVLGDATDDEIRERIDHIMVYKDKLEFFFTDGRAVFQPCDKVKTRKKYSRFSKLMYCQKCGSVFTRGVERNATKHKWTCKGWCGTNTFYEDELFKASEKVFGKISDEEFGGMVERIEVYAGELVFCLKGGRRVKTPCTPRNPRKWTEEAIAAFNREITEKEQI